jgi:uncharacterized protein YaiI (UPF0178 family)
MRTVWVDADACPGRAAAAAAALRSDGARLTAANLGPALAARDLAADLHAADPFRRGAGRAFAAAGRSRVLDALDRALRGH